MAESDTLDLVNITQSVKLFVESLVTAKINKITDESYARHLFKEYLKKVGIITKINEKTKEQNGGDTKK